MEKLPVERRAELGKMSTDRLRARLIKAGFEEDDVLAMERGDLLTSYAEYLINPPVVAEAAGGMAEAEVSRGMSAEEIEMRKMELEIKRQREERLQQEFERQKQKDQEAEQRRMEEKQEAEQRRLEEKQEAEERRQEEKTLKERELMIREQELERQRAKDEAELKRKESMAGQTKFYGDALNKVLRKMGDDPSELPTYFTHVENQFVFYNVPKQLQAKLLMPFLNDRARSLLDKLPKERLDDYQQVREFLLREFKLTPEQYREKFWTMDKRTDETFTVFGTRIKNLFQYYLDSRKIDDKDGVVDLIVTDRIKQIVSPPCLRHVLSTEASGWLRPDKLTEVIDIFENSQLNVAQRSVTYGRGSHVVKPLKASTSGSGTTTPSQAIANARLPATGNRDWKCFRCGKLGHVARACRSTLPVANNYGQNKTKAENKTKQEAKVNQVAVESPESISGPVTLSDQLSLAQVFSSSKVDVRIPDSSFYNKLDQEIAQICETTAKCDAAYSDCVANVDDRIRTLPVEPGLEVCGCSVKRGVSSREMSFDTDEPTLIYPLLAVEQDEGCSLASDDNVSVELAALQYCEVELELLNRPVRVLKDSGAQINLIKPSTLDGLDVSSHGMIAIRGIIGPAVEVPLISLKIRPYPGFGFESIAPFIEVTFGVCEMTTEVEMVLSDPVIRQLDALNAYTVVKPVVMSNNRSQETQTPPQVCEKMVGAVALPDQEGDNRNQVIVEGNSNDNDDDTQVKFVPSFPQITDDTEAKRLRDEQRMDISLRRPWSLAEEGKGSFYVKDDLLYHRDQVMGQKVEQICVPTGRREEICHAAHDLAHQGYKRTKERIQQSFFWPEMNKSIKEYVDSCLQCQQKARAVVKDRIPISVIPRDQIPFSHMYMDCIGPLFDKAEYNYCLCVIDSHTRYPFAFPLHSVNAKAVCDCLLQIFSLVGISSVITSDQGTCFTAKLTQEFMKMFGCSPRFSTPLHPEGNSLVERTNQNIKKILHHVCKDHPKQWHKVLPLVLWCIREARSEVLGVSPFMMLLGRTQTNPLKLVKESWTGENQIPSTIGKSVSEYLSELQTKLKEIHDSAESHATVEQQRYVNQYNRKARHKEFQLGQQVIVLIPDSTNKLLKKWQGPASVVEKKSNSYLIELDHGQRRWLHANLLRPYHPRVDQAVINNCSIVYEEDEDFGSLPINCSPPFDDKLPSQRVEDAKLAHLTSEQRQEFLSLLDEFADVFISKPGLCKVGVHEINVTPEFKPKRLTAYKIPELLKPEVSRQIQELLDLGFIRPSDSEMASPAVCVLKGRKGEGGVRLCCDYRYLNKYTRGDAHPTPDI